VININGVIKMRLLPRNIPEIEELQKGYKQIIVAGKHRK
jgi:hypothetical protein